MRFTTLKTFIWISTLLVAVLVTLLVNSLVTRPTVQDATIPRPVASGDETSLVRCDPLVIVMDAEENVYWGKNRLGSMAHPLDLTSKLKEVIEERDSRLAYASGMNLSSGVPLPPCFDEPVYIKSADDANLKALVRTLHEAGVEATRLIVVKNRKKAQSAGSKSH
jgi:hypothetical protein